MFHWNRVNTFPIGVTQEIHPDDIDDEDSIEKTINLIINTYSYMNKIMTLPQFASIRTICQNSDEYCSALAADGACNEPTDDDEEQAEELYNFMMTECTAACQVCENLISEEDAEIVKNCVLDAKTDIFGPGDLNKMFERIVGESEEGDDVVVPKKNVRILSRPNHPPNFTGNDDDPTDYVIGPWVVTLDNFVTDEECDRLIQLGSKMGYTRSSLEEEKNYDKEELEQEREGDDAYRTSTNTWCDETCNKDELGKNVISKLANATGIPDAYSEQLQLLSYIPGQYYKDHHDWIPEQTFHPPGPRIITFFLYLNNVEEGGATRLTDLTGDDGGIFLDIQPKKGMALVWPSALDIDPMKIDDRTFHEALAVTKGRKYGANAWFHLRKFKDDLCDYDALNEIGERSDTEEEKEVIASASSDEL